MSRLLVLGDVHGGARSLAQVLGRCGFEDSDHLVFLGDVADGWPETKEAVEILLEIPNKICLEGNHDSWTKKWVTSGWYDQIWLSQGGRATVQSYSSQGVYGWADVPEDHKKYFQTLQPYHYDEERNFVFVHGGFSQFRPLENHTIDELAWDRSLWQEAMMTQEKIGGYEKIFLGHTSIGASGPIKSGNVWNLDTGGGWEGVLTIMDAETEEYWQSDIVTDLYPNVRGRR